ncbi:hypothetical protein LIER_38830 [Lithospermum erythrorhizon]|uniref:non-reducing end alpha-L-arabinofuranosidase n=1 Tax=Lithospermum erythrorhizon TaxID=34254 RepID=A0AAV3Q7R7_LITER
MELHHCFSSILVSWLVWWCASCICYPDDVVYADQTASLNVDFRSSGQKIPDSLFGISFEEINHAGAGGLWAELVNNRGFEAGGKNTPSNIDPWTIMGDESLLVVSTDRSSCFDRNEIALRMEVLCDNTESTVNSCPAEGVGVYNPGFWGMNIEKGKTYKVIMYVRSFESINISIALTGPNGLPTLAKSEIIAEHVSNWTKVEVMLEAHETNHNSRLQLTTTRKGVIWFDQVSAMPMDTFKGHGFRSDLFKLLADLHPGFIRFPGGSFVEGQWLMNAFRWKETIGSWETRAGHFNDVWRYWTDDGLGQFEFLQLAEDLGALPVWVFNNGISFNDVVDSSTIYPFVQEILDGIEFARGSPESPWGSIRASMGHPKNFDLRYVAIGNQDCWRKNYRGNYLKFYSEIKSAYPDIQIVSNCDGSSQKLDHPADLYDFHVYRDAKSMFSMANYFDHTMRGGPKAFVSEYAVTGNEAGRGNLLAAVAEAGFLIGLERNSDVVEMASKAPLFVNVNNQGFNPDAIVFNSWQSYGTPSYWMQHLFKNSNGAILVNSTLHYSSGNSLISSAVSWKSNDGKTYLRIKIVNFGNNKVNATISIDGLKRNSVRTNGSTQIVLTSGNVMDENSFNKPTKVAPVRSALKNASNYMKVTLSPNSINCFDLLIESGSVWEI